MHNSHLINKYQTVQYSNIKKTTQVVMLYNSMEKFIKQSIDALKNSNLEIHYNMMMKTTSIITALHNSIDFDKGGEIAKVLHNYYTSLSIKILSIYKDNNIDLVEELLKDIIMMRTAWEEIDKSSN
ncbi:Flagellar protein FliS [Rickettsiales bacterium Ac37b]|nr:Flagellar protein FliS [Rickettsiales bacterium Ac37b]